MKIGYLDLCSGLSGDIFLGCLLDAGWPLERLRAVVASLGLDSAEWSIDVRTVDKAGLRATLAVVEAAEGPTQRTLVDVTRMIGGAELDASVRDRATAVFTRLADAEARVHGTSPERVHFHEVGAVDALIDIVGAVAGMAELGLESVFASAVPLGSGWARTAHGRIPLPAPATLELLAGVGAPTRPAQGPGEWVTPTGAALLAELCTFARPRMSVERVGVGAGRKDAEWPNVARLWVGEAEAPDSAGATNRAIVQLETNIDDMNPQLYAPVCDKLFAAGARDVWLTPIQMKKNRPAVLLSVLADASDEKKLCDILLRETTTLGVRVHAVARRHEAGREMRRVSTPFGEVAVKVKLLGGKAIDATPEFNDCRRLADAAGVPVRTVIAAAADAALILTLRRETAPKSDQDA